MKNISPSSANINVCEILQGYPEYIDKSNHTGIDIYCQKNHSFISVLNGAIWQFRNDQKTHINILSLIDKETDHIIQYKHCNPVYKEIGTKINEEMIIGCPDDSGKDTHNWNGYHLHFQVWEKDDLFDPVIYLLIKQPDLKYKFSNEKLHEYYMLKPYYNRMKISL